MNAVNSNPCLMIWAAHRLILRFSTRPYPAVHTDPISKPEFFAKPAYSGLYDRPIPSRERKNSLRGFY